MLKSVVGFAMIGLLGACAQQQPVTAVAPAAAPPLHAVIPVPVAVTLNSTERFTVDTSASVLIAANAPGDVAQVARYLATLLAPSADGTVRTGSMTAAKPIRLSVDPSQPWGAEGYDLTIGSREITLVASSAAGLFYGVQTIRQLLPHSVEHPAAVGRKLSLPTGRITDSPRFEWRGLMLDVSRHFLPSPDVKRFIDAMALYKLNRLHLHLSDDQGWRIEIKSRPNLTAIGGSTAVGGGRGGFYTQAEYVDLVAYAAARFITVIPEIDMPAHTNAALASYPDLNCDKIAPPLYKGIAVGFSALCVDSASVLPFVQDVVREISAITPGNYFHIGGDEVKKLTKSQYIRFIESVQRVVTANGKRMIGWGEIAPAALLPNTIVQSWIRDSSALHAGRGGKVILSPSPKLYLDMKYDSSTTLGLAWAGLIEVKTAYDWDPATFIPGVGEASILGVEGPLWSETLEKPEDYERMAFPRLLAVAELGWSPNAARSWNGFRQRLAAHGARMSALGLNYYRSPQIDWLP